jgi:hypothetical protein
MTGFVTLSCPSCGGKLEITEDVERFACSHCGQEHIVKRGGGIVSISPLVQGLKNIEIGVDKTAAELALKRISNELVDLINEKKNLLDASPYPKEFNETNLKTMIFIGCILISISILLISRDPEDFGYRCFSTFFFIAGSALVIPPLYPILTHNTKRVKEKMAWEATTGVRIKSLDEKIALINSELERNRKLISQ